MSDPSEKGSFSTDIAQSIIEEAMKSVDKAKAAVEGVDMPVDAPASEAAPAEEAAAPDARQAEIDALKAELETARTEVKASQEMSRDLMGKFKDEHEKLLRSVADLENYKKRAQKEKEETQKYGQEKLLKDFFPVFDNFDRALEHAKTSDDFESLKKGVIMMRKLMLDTFGKHNVKAFTAKGLPFDPNMHEAMSQAESADMPANHVFAEILSGFTLNERMVRPALVVVSKAPAAKPVEAEKPAEAKAEEKTEKTAEGDASKTEPSA